MSDAVFPSLFEGYAWLDGHVNLERKLGDVSYGPDAFGLESFRQRLEQLGDPQKRLRTIHIAGTRGKGSSALMLEALLQAGGARVATFTSPHIYEYRERIRIGGESVPPAIFLEALGRLSRLEEIGDDPPHPTGMKTVFENLTALFFMIAAEAGVDWAIVETGLGGRLDATNAVEPGPVLLTRIGLEHTQLLGDTIDAIAAEKAAILKAGGWGVFGVQSQIVAAIARDGSESVFRSRALEVQAPLFAAESLAPIRRLEAHETGLSLTLGFEGESVAFELPLLGPFQAENLQNALAILAALRMREGLPRVEPARLAAALNGLRIPGRMERVAGMPELIVDAAHCSTGAAAVARAMAAHFGGDPARSADLIIGIMADKDHEGFLRELARWPGWRRVYCYRPDTPRGLDAGVLVASAKRHFDKVKNCTNLSYALESWGKEAEKGIRALATGTLYSVAHLLDWGRKRAGRDEHDTQTAAAAESEPDSRDS